MKKKLVIGSLMVALLLCFGAAAFAANTVNSVQDGTVTEGIFIDDVDVSGMTEAEVVGVIEDKVAAMNAKTITIKTDAYKKKLKLSKIGVTCDNTEIVDEIMSLGKTGNLIARFKEIEDLKKDNKVYNLEYKFNQKALKKYVTNKLKGKYDQDAVEPTMTREDGKFVVTKGKNGISVKVKATVAAIKKVLTSTDENITVKTVCKVTKPEHSYKALKAIKDVLGSKTTTYDSGNVGRTQSLQLSTSRLNGTIIWPGETISASVLMGERSVAGGYGTAQGYIGTSVEDTVGAGICQTASTLYNAALWAELDVVEREHHTLIVHYVDYAMDSTIYAGDDYKNPQKDLKLKNPYDYPVYIEASAGGGYCTFKIWGKETRPSNRTIDYVSTTVYESYPADQVTYDSSQYEGYYAVTQGAFPAVQAYLTKYVYVDGKQTEKTVLHTDTYTGSGRQVIQGTKKKETEKTDDSKSSKKKSSGSKSTKKSSGTTKSTKKSSGSKKSS